MELTIHVDSTCQPLELRSLAAMLLSLAGDIPMGDFNAATKLAPAADAPPPPPPPPAKPDVKLADLFPNAPPPPPPPLELAQQSAAPLASLAPADYDSAGMPWDVRIHQRLKAKKKDGTWKIQKNISPELVQHVTAELASKKLSVSTAAAPPPPAAGAPPPPPPAPPAAGAPPPPPPGFNINTAFRDFMQKVIEVTTAQRMTSTEISQLVQRRGSPNLSELAKTPQLIPDIIADIDAFLISSGR